MAERIIFHVDVNSAFLAWTAAHRVAVLGETDDLRDVPSVICGDKENRKGIILAKSTPAKKFGVQTGEPLFLAMEKCPDLVVAKPDYSLYVGASRKFMELLQSFSPVVEQYSIDEAWVDMSGTMGLYGSPLEAAEMMRARVWKELGFTVNIGISSNKLLAKMAGDFEKPNKIHTLFPEEMEQKFWPLPVGDLFSVGKATKKKLSFLGITTIGQLAQADVNLLRQKFGKQGESIWHLANGRDIAEVKTVAAANKGYGNSITTPADVTTFAGANKVLLSLCETVGMRMRQDGVRGQCITVHVRTRDFSDSSHQRQMGVATNVTQELYDQACQVLAEHWDGKSPLRQIGVQATKLSQGESPRQVSLFDEPAYERKEKIDAAVDILRKKFGEQSVIRARFLDNPDSHMAGGLDKERRTGVTKAVPKDN